MNLKALLYFSSIFLATLLLYFPVFSEAAPLWDDYHFLFQSERFIKAESFLDFFGINRKMPRSWPLTYSTLWLLFKIVGKNFIYYKILNFSIHFVNCIFLFKLLKETKSKYTYFIVAIFAIHPINIESVAWIFQLSTLLSTTFLLITILSAIKFIRRDFQNIYLVFTLLAFTISLLFKITGILIPLSFLTSLYVWNRGFLRNKKIIFCLITMFSLSLWRGGITLKGITFDSSEVESKKQYLTQENDPSHVTKALLKSTNFDYEDLKKWNKSYYDEFQFNKFKLKRINIIATSATHYLFSFISINELMYFYPKDKHFSFSYIFLAYFIVIATLIILYYFRRDKILLIVFSFFFFNFIPVSGLFYIPFMKFSLTADHWFYAPLIFLLLLMSLLLNKFKTISSKRYIIMALIIFCITQALRTFKYSQIFSRPKDLLFHTIRNNPKNPFPYLLLTEYFYKENDFKSGLEVLEKWNLDNFNQDILNLQLFGLLKTNKVKDAMEIILKLASIYINDDSLESIEMVQYYLSLGLKIDKKNPRLKTLLNLFAQKVLKTHLLEKSQEN